MAEESGNPGGIAGGGANKNYHGKDIPDRVEATKRLAQQGQWRTPPLPVFAAGVTHANAASTTASAAVSATATANKIPTTPDEYARMLQEAYKRGAEAGARLQQTSANRPGGSTATAVAAGVHPSAVRYAAPPPTTAAARGMAVARTTPNAGSIQVVNGYAAAPLVPPAVPSVTARPSSSSVSHSKSMPDMSSYHAALANVDDEEDKRKKRLARNRASARLRRLKKKNLVDSYEGEVGILESSLSKLRSHRWGSSSAVVDHEALVEALSMERGQQPLTPEKRRELVQSIVSQQREQVNNLLDCQLENWIFGALADSCDGGAGGPPDEELDQVTSELRSMLKLTPNQVSRIKQSSQGCTHEVQDLFTVDNCLQSIQQNKWLLDEGVDEVAGQFTSILNPAQLSKFLLWSDHNAETIEKLDFVNVIPGVGKGPVFEFGVDEGLTDGD